MEVRELPWKAHIRIIKELTSHVKELLSAQRGPSGEIELDVDVIVSKIASMEDLTSWVMQQATGKDAAWVEGLSGREALIILTETVKLNLSPELVGAGKELAGHMGAVFGLKGVSLAS